MDWIISRLADTGRSLSSLRKEPFNSGQPELDRYLKQFAKKNDETGFSRTFIALPSEGSQIIAGYYSCSASMLDRNELPDDLRARLPNYPPPALLMGKLAVVKRSYRDSESLCARKGFRKAAVLPCF